MTDTSTNKRLKVSNEGTAGPYVELPFSQVEDLTGLLKKHDVFFWVEENIISFDEGPFFALVEFGRRGDAEAIQKILDSVP